MALRDDQAAKLATCLFWGQNVQPARSGRGGDRITHAEQKHSIQTWNHNQEAWIQGERFL